MSSYAAEAQERMKKCIANLQETFARIRTGRANPHILDAVEVDYYGTNTPITQLAAIKVSEATNLLVEPWDKSALSAIEKAIQQSDLGITPNNDGVALRLPFPAPTEERRKELVKECKAAAEEAKVAVRNVRRDCNGKISRDEELTDDEKRRGEASVQKATDEAVAQIDSLAKAKEAEVMEI